MPRAYPRLTVAICAYNEEANIGHLLQAILQADQQGTLVDEVLVVSSGSTDSTDAIVRRFSRCDPRLRLITQEQRQGKLAAVNIALGEAKNDHIVLADADCLPGEGSLQWLAQALAERGVGGVGSRNVPVNAREGPVARMAALMWEMHHLVNLHRPVLGGDIVAFRRVFTALPEGAGVNDDFVLECELRRRGYRIVYQPRAVTYMRVPTSLADLVRQRRRIHYGFLKERRSLGAVKATQRPWNIMRATGQLLWRQPGLLPPLALLAAVEAWSRLLARRDAACQAEGHKVWQVAASTKGALTTRHSPST